MKTVYIIVGIVLIVILGIMLVKYIPSGKSSFTNFFPNSPMNLTSQGTANIKGHSIKIIVAKTSKEQRVGLSDRNSLPQDTGMLFTFNRPDYYLFWMRHMKFPLDIIYINNNKVVTLFENVKNPPYAMENPPILRPNMPADKVLELNTGTAKKYNLKVGDIITITL